MQYFDKNGKEIKAGMKILMEDGNIEMVYGIRAMYQLKPPYPINEYVRLRMNAKFHQKKMALPGTAK